MMRASVSVEFKLRQRPDRLLGAERVKKIQNYL